MSEVNASALFSNFATLRPFPDFMSKYEGLNALETPIALPGVLDARAGSPGYDPALLAGQPVPMGSQVMVWLPRFTQPFYGATVTPTYNYQFVWRIRPLQDQTSDTSDLLTGHFGRTLPGAPQDAGASPNFPGDPGPRVVIPAAFETVQVTSSVVGDPRSISVQTAMYQVAGIGNAASPYAAPILSSYPGAVVGAPKAGASAMLSQGLYPNGNGSPVPTNDNAAFSGGPQYVVAKTQALGDELIVLISRASQGGEANWDFETLDKGLATMFNPSYPNVGIYVATGAYAT